MSVESRFATTFAEKSNDEPGLALQQDGTVEVILPDGTRAPVNGGPGGGGIDFDQENVGGTLAVTADGEIDFSSNTASVTVSAGDGVSVSAVNDLTLSGGAVVIQSEGNQVYNVGASRNETVTGDNTTQSRDLTVTATRNLQIEASNALTIGAGGSMNLSSDTDFTINVDGAGDVSILATGGGNIVVDPGAAAVLIGASGAKVGFFGAAGVGRQATPTTLPEVIAILSALGLCS